VSKSTWLVFVGIETIGCILAGYGSAYFFSAEVKLVTTVTESLTC